MWYIKSMPENSSYGNPHYPERDGDIELPDNLVSAYLSTKGFAILTVVEDVVAGVERNAAAYNAYEREHPDLPPEPSQIDRVEAQTLFTALMTDTLLED